MTSKQRQQYLTLHAVRELVRGMAEHRTQYARKTRGSLERIEAKVSLMLPAMGPLTAADIRYFSSAAAKLRAAWTDEGDNYTPAAFVAIALTLIADQCAMIPAKAASVRRDFADLEGMLSTLYRHFDPDMTDTEANATGEAVAVEYRALVAA